MAKTKKSITGKATSGKGSSAKKKSAEKKTTEKTPDSVPAAEGKTVPVNRRSLKDRRKAPDRRKAAEPVAVERRTIERRAKVSRRRQIDPTTCERDYTLDEIEFMNALEDYKRASGRMFPTCSEILEVLKKLGYEKRPQHEGPAAAESALEDPAAPSQPGAQRAAI